MRILILTQSFPPEAGALPSRMYPIARELSQAGHAVFVATGMPNYPKGIVFPAYRGKLNARERVGSYTVLRTAYYCVPRNISRARQGISYLSFLPAVLASALRAGRVDLVFVTSPPIFPAIVGMLLARVYRAKLVFDIRDLWPDEIVACGGASGDSVAVRSISRLERRIYSRSDLICCTTRAFVDTLISRGADPGKLRYLPNGADLELFQPAIGKKTSEFSRDLKDKFVVLFSGILGMKQGLETLLTAAKILEQHSNIVFVLVGGGSRKNALASHIQAMGITNVILLGEKPLGDIPALIQAADVCVSMLKPDPYLQKIVSVKIYEYLACGKPVIGAHEGESARIISESGAGIVVPPGDPLALANAIALLHQHDDMRAQLGSNGRDWVERHHSRTTIARELEREIRALFTPAPESRQVGAEIV